MLIPIPPCFKPLETMAGRGSARPTPGRSALDHRPGAANQVGLEMSSRRRWGRLGRGKARAWIGLSADAGAIQPSSRTARRSPVRASGSGSTLSRPTPERVTERPSPAPKAPGPTKRRPAARDHRAGRCGGVFPPGWRRPPPACLRCRTSWNVVGRWEISDPLTCLRASLQRSKHGDAESVVRHAVERVPQGHHPTLPGGFRDEAPERSGPLGRRAVDGHQDATGGAQLGADSASRCHGATWEISYAPYTCVICRLHVRLHAMEIVMRLLAALVAGVRAGCHPDDGLSRSNVADARGWRTVARPEQARRGMQAVRAKRGRREDRARHRGERASPAVSMPGRVRLRRTPIRRADPARRQPRWPRRPPAGVSRATGPRRPSRPPRDQSGGRGPHIGRRAVRRTPCRVRLAPFGSSRVAGSLQPPATRLFSSSRSCRDTPSVIQDGAGSPFR